MPEIPVDFATDLKRILSDLLPESLEQILFDRGCDSILTTLAIISNSA
jgi:hypothetical protein